MYAWEKFTTSISITTHLIGFIVFNCTYTLGSLLIGFKIV